MKRKYWRDVGFFVLGTFLGGMVLGFLGGLVKKVP
jgi:hypothetical protein